MSITPRRQSRLRGDDNGYAEIQSPGLLGKSVTGHVGLLRANREDERSELQELNKRLEMYILRQREKEAGDGGWKREFELLLQKYERDIKKLKTLFDQQLVDMRRVNNEQLDSMNELKSENTTLASDLTHVSKDLNSLKGYSESLTEQNKTLALELAQTKSKLLAATEESRGALRDLETERLRNSQLRNDNASLKVQFDETNVANARAETTILGLRDQVTIIESSTQKEIDMLRRQLSESIARGDENMQAVRKEYEQRMNTVFEERYRAAGREKEDALSTIKEDYDDKVLGYRASLENMGHDLEVERNKVNAAINDLNTVLNENDELKGIIEGLQANNDELKETIDNMRKAESDIIAEKNDVIRKIKDAFKQKDQEFDQLMDVKIALALEMKVLESLLESEEERLGITGKVDLNQDYLEMEKPVETPGFLDRLFNRKSAPTHTPRLQPQSQLLSGPTNTSPSLPPLPLATQSPVQEPRKRRRVEDSPPTLPPPSQQPKPHQSSRRHQGPPRPERRTSKSPTPPSAASSSLLISGKDKFGQYVSIRNGAEDDVNLSGWALQTSKNGFRFTFPDEAILSAGDSFTLRTGDQQEGDWPNTAWTGSAVWDAAGDECLLINTEDEIKARVDIAAVDEVPTLTITSNQDQQCSIM